MKNVADIWPLAPLQELMLAHTLANPGSQLLTEQFHCTITGSLDPVRFRQAWEAVVARHALLRTGFAWEGLKKPLQVVRREVELPWREHDWCGLSSYEAGDRREVLLREARDEGFDLARPPLVRCDLAQVAQHEWFFVWTCHHLVLDGWCLGIVLREAFEHYADLVAGRSQAAETAPLFSEYLKWLNAQDEVAVNEFWRGQLQGNISLTPLPLGDVTVPKANDDHAACETKLSAVDSARLLGRAQAERIGANAFVEAAWAILLARHADCDDVTFGVTVSGRPPELSRVDAIVGPFVNNVPRRVNMSLDSGVAALWRRLHALQIDTQPFEHCSLERIAQASGRHDGRLFDSLVVYENYPLHAVAEFSLADIAVSRVNGTTTSAYPLTLVAMPGHEFTLRLLYDRQLFSDEAAARLLEQVVALLRGIAAHPEARVRDLALVERRELELLNCLDEQVPSLRVLDGAQQPVPPGMPGRLWIAENPGIATRSASMNKPRLGRVIIDPLDQRGTRTLRDTGYLAALLADGEIECLGPSYCRRPNEQRGATSSQPQVTVRIGRSWVDPHEVEALLRLCPLIDDVTLLAQADRTGLNRLAAYIVPTSGSSMALVKDRGALVIEEVRRFIADRAPACMVPTAWRALDSVPRDMSGALNTTALPPVLSPRPNSAHPYVAPRDIWEQRVAQVWSQVLGVEPVGVTDNFLDLGGHSSLAVALLARLGEEFGRRLPLAAMFEEPTVEHLASLLRQAPADGGTGLIVPIRSSGTRPPLFCIHPAGGTVFCYLELAQQIDADVPVYGIQAQGIDGTEAPHDSIESMAVEYIRAIKTVQSTGPYYLCGWSTGGVIAFEVARQLHEQGDEIALVGLIDAAIPSGDRQFDENDLVPMLQMMFPGEDAGQLRRLRELPIEKQVAYFQERAANARLLLAGASARGARAVFDVFEANMRAVVAYRPRPLAAPLLVVRATEQATPMHADPHLGWGAWAIGGLATVEVPGSHLTMLEAPAVTKLATILRPYLALPHCAQSEQLASRRNPLPDHVTASITVPLVVA